MKQRKHILLLPTLALLLPLLANTAPAADQLHVVREVQVNAPSSVVWRVISDFCAIQNWHPAVAKCRADGGSQPGTVRILTLGNGAMLRELLTIHDARRKTYSYAIAESKPTTLPVLDYHSSIRVLGRGSSSTVRWEGTFYSQGDDRATIEAITGVYDAGLEEIRKLATLK